MVEIFRLAIPLSLARQERRATALVAGPFGLSYFFLLFRMDANTTHARNLLKIAYAHHPARPSSRREPFHLGWIFDAAVIVALLIAVVGYITA